MTSPTPSTTPSALNVALFVRDHVPTRIRSVQAELRALEEKRSAMLDELRTLTDTAVLHGIELFPQVALQGGSPAARASGPGGTDTPPGLAGTDGVSPASRAA